MGDSANEIEQQKNTRLRIRHQQSLFQQSRFVCPVFV
jgi:hypothetical protein